MSVAFRPGQRVKAGQYEGTLLREYMPDVWEVRFPGGVAIRFADELRPTDPESIGTLGTWDPVA
jgi:hypothetical protein